MSNGQKETQFAGAALHDKQALSPEEMLLLEDLRRLIEQSRQVVAHAVNSEMTLMYWHIGERINQEILKNERAEYGKKIVATVAVWLQRQFGAKGFDEKSIRRMMQFAQLLPDFQIVASLARQLSWSHFIEILPLKNGLQREFYLTMAAEQHWSRRSLRQQIDSMLFERTAVAAKPDELIR